MLTLLPFVMTVCAHFLFIRIGPAAEAGQAAEVYFSEQAEAGDPKFVTKVAGTKLWVQTAPRSFKPLEVREGVDRLRASLPSSETLSVVGACEYGVLARPKEVPFLLRYYPKAIAGDPGELNRMTAREEIPLEIMGKLEGDKIHLVLLKQGKPVPGVVFHAVDADLTESEATAGPDGTAVWTPPARAPIRSTHATRPSDRERLGASPTRRSANSPHSPSPGRSALGRPTPRPSPSSSRPWPLVPSGKTSPVSPPNWPVNPTAAPFPERSGFWPTARSS